MLFHCCLSFNVTYLFILNNKQYSQIKQIVGGRSSEVPVSVHKLRPGDIDVIAAMGDSLTAGAGIFADNVVQIFIENRGVSATGGGQGTWREYLTIPNILKVSKAINF